MIQLKTPEQIEIMKVAGRITAEALLVAKEMIHEGVTTKEIDDKINQYIKKCGAKPTFLGYGGFPGSACISINDEVIHGIPSRKRVLKNGDIVKIDVGAMWHGFTGDSARTFAVGEISEEAKKLIKATEESFFEAIKAIEAAEQPRIGDIGYAIQSYVEARGYSAVREFVGHGVGAKLHEDPNVPNFGTAGRGVRIYPGMTLAIEPMINEGTEKVRMLNDGWGVVTADGKLSAHYENSIAVTDNGVIILTKVD
ncbi:MAG: type I methionyl aminopeptidase [Clostridia bacterium]|nr:type I methionyl aminopeptidase [Clostridia bacterium]MBQ9703579.1 type I methionyl aminopeptidase [Clostridia bacterium]